MSSTDRSIHLDIGLPPRSDLGTAPGESGPPMPKKDQRGEEQMQQDAGRLQSLLKGSPAAAPAPTPSAERPFDLFGPGTSLAAAAPSPASARPEGALAGLEDRLSQMAGRLLVGEGRHGGASVRMQLAGDDLNGVVMEVFEDEGAVIAQFTCSQEDPRERLARAAPWLAEQLAARLQRDTLVRVLADDPEDPCPVEARGTP